MDAVEDQAGTRKPPPGGQDWLHLTAAQGPQSCPERGVREGPACGGLALRVLVRIRDLLSPSLLVTLWRSCQEAGRGAAGFSVCTAGLARPSAEFGPGRDGGWTLRLSPHRGDTVSSSLTVTLLLCKKGWRAPNMTEA